MPDVILAEECLRRAAEQGHTGARNQLGRFYLYGPVMMQNRFRAASWFLKAAEQGDAEAQNNIAMMYAKGTGVPLDKREAYSWFFIAGRLGHAEARRHAEKMRVHIPDAEEIERKADETIRRNGWK